MTQLQLVEHSGQRILTTRQIAEAYETDEKVISKNFTRNKDHYTLGKHYYALEGKEKLDFLANRRQFDDGLKKAKVVYLWTEKGAFLHAKSLGTNKAWEVYESLIDEYYRLVREVPKTEQHHRVCAWTEEAEQLRQINMKEVRPGYWSSSAFVLQKLIYVDLGNMAPNERAKIDISFGKFFPRWLRGDRSGQLKGCTIFPEHPHDESKVMKVGHVVDSATMRSFDVCHYANLYAGDRDNFWDMWYAPVILPCYFNGRLPGGLPRMIRTNLEKTG